jgi:hypothetical protein
MEKRQVPLPPRQNGDPQVRQDRVHRRNDVPEADFLDECADKHDGVNAWRLYAESVS